MKPHPAPLRKIILTKKHLARRAALQALYQYQFSHQNMREIQKQFEKDHYQTINHLDESDSPVESLKIDETYFADIIHGVIENKEAIDSYIKRYTNRPLNEVDAIELCISRIATFELLKKPEIPPKVILNEALELTKLYGSAEGFKFINGVCDKIAREIRPLEFAPKITKK